MTTTDPTPSPSVLVFDVNETLIDIDSIAPLFGSCSVIGGYSASGSASWSCTR